MKTKMIKTIQNTKCKLSGKSFLKIINLSMMKILVKKIYLKLIEIISWSILGTMSAEENVKESKGHNKEKILSFRKNSNNRGSASLDR